MFPKQKIEDVLSILNISHRWRMDLKKVAKEMLREVIEDVDREMEYVEEHSTGRSNYILILKEVKKTLESAVEYLDDEKTLEVTDTLLRMITTLPF